MVEFALVLAALLLLGATFLIARRQMNSFGTHVDRVSRINEEISAWLAGTMRWPKSNSPC